MSPASTQDFQVDHESAVAPLPYDPPHLDAEETQIDQNDDILAVEFYGAHINPSVQHDTAVNNTLFFARYE